MKPTLTFTLLALAAAISAKAGDPISIVPDSTHHTLFNPTPRNKWRELSPDRPDATESPITVDAGAFVIETGVQIGLNDAAEDLGLFGGFAKRF